MKRLFVILSLFPALAWAEPIALQFRDIKIPALVDAIVKVVLKREYVLSPEVARMDSALTLTVRPDRSAVLDVLRNTLASSGVVVVDRAGILYVEKRTDQPRDESVSANPVLERVSRLPELEEGSGSKREVGSYFPRYRTAEMLALAAKAAGANIPDLKGRADVVVFSGSADLVAKITQLLIAIDQPTRSVNVKAALLEVTDTSESQRGLGVLLSALKGRLGLAYQVGKAQTNYLSFTGPDLQAVLSAVDGDSRFHSLAQPSMRVLDGEVARLVVGAEVPTRGQTIITNGQTTQGVDYKTAGVVLQVEPRIQAESIILKISQSISDFSTTTTSGIDSPTMTKREASTTVEAEDGEILVIAGMDQNKDSRSGSGLSFLPSFLKSRSVSASNSQMLLLLEVKRHNGKAAAL